MYTHNYNIPSSNETLKSGWIIMDLIWNKISQCFFRYYFQLHCINLVLIVNSVVITLKFSEVKIFRSGQSYRTLLRVQIEILKSSLSDHYCPLKHLELHIQKVSPQKALVTIHHFGCIILWKTAGEKYRTRVMPSFVLTVLAAPGFMCSSILASTSLPLVHQTALAATCRPQVRTATAFHAAHLTASCTLYR